MRGHKKQAAGLRLLQLKAVLFGQEQDAESWVQ